MYIYIARTEYENIKFFLFYRLIIVNIHQQIRQINKRCKI